jgi:hypothetical protein
VHKLVDRRRNYETEEDSDDLLDRRKIPPIQQLPPQYEQQDDVQPGVRVATLDEVEAEGGRRKAEGV